MMEYRPVIDPDHAHLHILVIARRTENRIRPGPAIPQHEADCTLPFGQVVGLGVLVRDLLDQIIHSVGCRVRGKFHIEKTNGLVPSGCADVIDAILDDIT